MVTSFHEQAPTETAEDLELSQYIKCPRPQEADPPQFQTVYTISDTLANSAWHCSLRDRHVN